MKKILGLAVIVLLAAPIPGLEAGAATVEGVRFTEQVRVGEHELELRGAALLRYKLFIKAYVAAFYVDRNVHDGIPLEKAGRRLEIEYFWDIPADGFAEATREGISRNVDRERYESLSDRIERLNALYRDVAPGDRYSLTYLPGVGTELSWNGQRLGIVEGEDFADAVFDIWLGNEPLDSSLKRELLGAS